MGQGNSTCYPSGVPGAGLLDVERGPSAAVNAAILGAGGGGNYASGVPLPMSLAAYPGTPESCTGLPSLSATGVPDPPELNRMAQRNSRRWCSRCLRP